MIDLGSKSCYSGHCYGILLNSTNEGVKCGAYVGADEEMMCVVCVNVTEGA